MEYPNDTYFKYEDIINNLIGSVNVIEVLSKIIREQNDPSNALNISQMTPLGLTIGEASVFFVKKINSPI